MKNTILMLLALTGITSYAQNQILNGNFQTGNLNFWQGFNNQVLTDDITNSLVGNINNGEGSLFQTLTLESGQTYTIAFNYRWISGSAGYAMTVRAKDENSASIFGSLILNSNPDEWVNGTFTFTVPTDVTLVRLVFYKTNGNRPLRIDDVYVTPQNSNSIFVDPTTPDNVQPLGVNGNWELNFSDEFNGTEINPLKWMVSVSNTSRNPRPNLGVDDWWWVEENAFLNGSGNLVLRGTKVDNNTMYCGSVESRNLYEPTYGYLEARIKIAETAKGNHMAFWTQGHNQGNVDNSGADGAEIDIFESAWVNNTTKAVVHFDGYGPEKKNHTIPYNTPNLHSGYHVFGLHWTTTSMDVYYDGVKMNSTNANKPFPFTVDPSGYALVPQVPEWLWLSVGASFADGDFQSQPVGTLSDALVDYVRVYSSSSTLAVLEPTSRNNFQLYPNPTQNIVHIESEMSNYTVNIYDLNGRLITTSEHSKSSIVNVAELSKGLYFFQIKTDQGVHSQKIFVD